MWGPYVPHFLILILIFFIFFVFLNIFNYKIKYKKNTAFWGLQICPSSIEFMSVTNVSNEMKLKCKQ